MRPASRRDLDRVTELWIALGEHHAAFEPLFALRAGADVQARQILAAQLEDPSTRVLLHDSGGALSGLCIARIDRAPEIQVERCRGEITDLFVREAARRRGVGRALAEAGIAWLHARGAKRVVVRVSVANATGQAFWRSIDFGASMDVLERRL